MSTISILGIRQVAITTLRRDETIQSREQTDDATVAEYAEAMQAEAEFPPVVAFDDGAVLWLADGFHRVEAAKWAGRTSLPVEVREGTRRDALLYAVGANQQHGLRRTNADKRKAVRTLLDDAEWALWSAREIARRCGVSPRFVDALRAELSAHRAQIDATRLVTRNGTTYPMHTAAIGGNGSSNRPTSRPVLDDAHDDDEPEPSRLAVHFSSETPEHYTPRHILDAVAQVFGDIPDLDPCSNSHERPHVAARQHYTAEDDGLAQPWRGQVFVNPPYGLELPRWVQKTRHERARGELTAIIALLPARPDTAWFEALTADGGPCDVGCFLRGRLMFVGNRDPAPFPSLVVYAGPSRARFVSVFEPLGILWQRMRA